MSNTAILKINQSESQSDLDAAFVVKYINRIWNQKRLGELSVYLDDHYVDHSIPHASFQNQEGLSLYLDQLAQMVSHTTEIVGLTTLGELVICQIKISVSSLSACDDAARGVEVFFGYRTFRMFNSKIAEHWEIL